MREKHLLGPFKGFFMEIKKSRDLHEKSREMADYMFCPNKKNNVTNVIITGALVVLCP